LGFPTGWLFTTHKDSLLHINLAPAANFLGAINKGSLSSKDGLSKEIENREQE
jgi:hypothetical protein